MTKLSFWRTLHVIIVKYILCTTISFLWSSWYRNLLPTLKNSKKTSQKLFNERIPKREIEQQNLTKKFRNLWWVIYFLLIFYVYQSEIWKYNGQASLFRARSISLGMRYIWKGCWIINFILNNEFDRSNLKVSSVGKTKILTML
jgi:hypothetical protein